MKKSILPLIALASTFVLTACSQGPEDVAEVFLEKGCAGDLVGMMEYVTPSIQSRMQYQLDNYSLSELKSQRESLKEAKACYEDLEFSVKSKDEDSAKIDIMVDGDRKRTISLTKIDGEWKIRRM